MAFGKRTTQPFAASPSAASSNGARERRGGYWLGAATPPVAFVIVTLVMAVILGGDEMATLMAAIPLAALSLFLWGLVVFLMTDFALRAVGWRDAWIYATVGGVAFLGLAFLSTVSLAYALPLTFAPGFLGGWVLGWTRR